MRSAAWTLIAMSMVMVVLTTFPADSLAYTIRVVCLGAAVLGMLLLANYTDPDDELPL